MSPQKISWETHRRVSYSITAWEINRAFYFDGFFSVVVEGKQRIGKTSCMHDKMGYYVELKFPKRDLIDILRREDRKALWKLVLESVQNFMEENI